MPHSFPFCLRKTSESRYGMMIRTLKMKLVPKVGNEERLHYHC